MNLIDTQEWKLKSFYFIDNKKLNKIHILKCVCVFIVVGGSENKK